MSRRVAALLFAVAVIATAVAIRSGRGDTGHQAGAPTTIDPTRLFRDSPLRVLCIEELAAVCSDLHYYVGSTRVEPAWTTVDRLATGGTLGADAWVTFRPLDEMAAPASPAQSTLGAPTSLGTSPIVMAGPTPVVTGAATACPDPRTVLSCVAARPGVQLMLRDPRTSPLGALALSVPADELGLPAPGKESDGRAAASLASLLSRGRRTPVPYEDVSRLKESGVALGVEADVVKSLDALDSTQRIAYTGTLVLYPFEARAVEAVVVPESSFPRSADVAALFGSDSVHSGMELLGYTRPGGRDDLYPKAVFAGRPTIRTDLPPPAPDRLRQLRSLPPAPAATPGGP